MTDTVRPTLQAIVDQAVAATGASTGWLLAFDPATPDPDLRIRAIAGGPGESVGDRLAPTGARAYVLSSGQAAALLPQPDDPANDGAGGFAGVPPSILAVPCGDDAIGVLEVVDKSGGLPFTFDDISVVTMLATVAAAALTEVGAGAEQAGPNPVSPAELAVELDRLATADPSRYRDTARLITGLLGT